MSAPNTAWNAVATIDATRRWSRVVTTRTQRKTFLELWMSGTTIRRLLIMCEFYGDYDVRLRRMTRAHDEDVFIAHAGEGEGEGGVVERRGRIRGGEHVKPHVY